MTIRHPENPQLTSPAPQMRLIHSQQQQQVGTAPGQQQQQMTIHQQPVNMQDAHQRLLQSQQQQQQQERAARIQQIQQELQRETQEHIGAPRQYPGITQTTVTSQPRQVSPSNMQHVVVGPGGQHLTRILRAGQPPQRIPVPVQRLPIQQLVRAVDGSVVRQQLIPGREAGGVTQVLRRVITSDGTTQLIRQAIPTHMIQRQPPRPPTISIPQKEEAPPLHHEPPLEPNQVEQILSSIEHPQGQGGGRMVVHSVRPEVRTRPPPPPHPAAVTGRVYNRVPAPATPAPQPPAQQRVQFFGHEPMFKQYPQLCLLGCVFLIVDYNKMCADEVENWKKVIELRGGELEQAYCERVTHVLCPHQNNPIVQQAIRERRRCVTAYWLSDVNKKKRLLPPWQALHLPTPFDEKKPCKNHMVCISGFEGEERVQVRLMLSQIGAKYTGYFSQHNTVLICRKPEGAKYYKAREWKKLIVNVQWLNEILLGHYNTVQLSDGQKYQQFTADDPFRIDYSLVQSLMAAWTTPIRVTADTWNRYKSRPPPSEKLKRSLEVDNSERPVKEMKSVSDSIIEMAKNEDKLNSILHHPFSHPSKDHNQHHPFISRDGGQQPPFMSRDTNQQPFVSRGNDFMHNTHSSSFPVKLEEGTSPVTNNNHTSPPVPIVIFSLVTDRELAQTVKRLGGKLAMSVKEATHLVMSKLHRTPKLLCAISTCDYIVSTKWLEECHKQNKFLEEGDFILEDDEIESQFSFKLKLVLSKPNRSNLFNGKTFYMTPGVTPSKTTLREIVECAGGRVEAKRLSVKQIKERNKEQPSYFIISCADDQHLQADCQRSHIPIYSTELILTSVLRQDMNLDMFILTS